MTENAQVVVVELSDTTIDRLAKAIAKELDGLGVLVLDAYVSGIAWDAASDIAEAVGRMLDERSETEDGEP